MLRHVVLFFILIWSFFVNAMDTETRLFRPYGDGLQQEAIVINQKITGECYQQSTRIKREDAWRCVADGRVYDPCFIKRYGRRDQAICPASPWSGASIMIDMSKPADNSQHLALDMSRTYPWGIELASGIKCQAIDAGSEAGGLPAYYQCENQSVLVGELQRCKPEWSMLEHFSDGRVESALVSRAWF
ncbi:hypothetical protein ACFORL_01860 [Legionella dresdenensis]|uniref:Uncharacterized protein n=1 Tax=Legionella dresdenensis TaxID=450200 RepID=A0ABV8CCK4_9GAMM